MIKFKARVFLANDGRPYMAKQYDNSIWVHFLHVDKKWVTLKEISLEKGFLIHDNLTDYEQSLYPKYNQDKANKEGGE